MTTNSHTIIRMVKKVIKKKAITVVRMDAFAFRLFNHPLQLRPAVIKLHLNVFIATVKVVDTINF